MTVDTRLIYERDGHRCPHCGHRADSIQHRMNRGAGGSRNPLKHAPSNLMAFCWVGNSGMESSSEMAAQAKEYGWKLLQHQNPLEVPIYDVTDNCWYALDDEYQRTPIY